MKWKIRTFAALSVILFVWYLVADRVTPFTSNVRVKAIVIDIVPEVSGYVAELPVSNGQLVEKGDLLARIDQRSFVLDVEATSCRSAVGNTVRGGRIVRDRSCPGQSGQGTGQSRQSEGAGRADLRTGEEGRLSRRRRPTINAPRFWWPKARCRRRRRTLIARSGSSGMQARTTPRSRPRPRNWEKPNLPCNGPSCARRREAWSSI